MEWHQIILRPIITEKMSDLRDQRKYAFEVDRRANKIQVKQAVERAFNVKVDSVNIINVKGERKRAGFRWYTTPSWKKAIVTLKDGYSIEFFEGL